jgi:hypothetical protein
MKQLLYVYGHADVKVFHLAICGTCGDPDKPLPMPFATSDERDQWMTEHATTGHPVNAATEIRVITP